MTKKQAGLAMLVSDKIDFKLKSEEIMMDNSFYSRKQLIKKKTLQF